MRHVVGASAGWLILALAASTSRAELPYHLRLNLSEFSGQSLSLAFQMTSPDSGTNFAAIRGFAHDGRTLAARVTAGDAGGGLIDGQGGPSAIIRDHFWANEVVIPLDSVGTTVTADIVFSEAAPTEGRMPDELSMVIDDSFGQPAFTTADHLGAGAVFAIDATGAPGGDLTVIAPMQFVPPDSLIMGSSATAVPVSKQLGGRLRFSAASPNPFAERVQLRYEVPPPGGSLSVRVFDIAGRLVAEPFRGIRKAGSWTAAWNGRTASGHLAAPGTYLVQIRLEGQTVVRRITFAH
ncbi:MAG TPA: FlgD immunoglobulin-like domain containing protein [Candidatus Eisenbacteria bacterium]|nr:FlgD immunoglobulin-like domain containing protein [Candidatus Eisenbacteria bacterium]